MGFSSVKKEVTIASGAAVSSVIDTTNFFYLAGLIMPLITTSTAITFTVSDIEDGTYVALHDGAGVVYSVTIDNTAVNAIALDPAIFYPWTFLKINVADNQGADRIIKAIVRGY